MYTYVQNQPTIRPMPAVQEPPTVGARITVVELATVEDMIMIEVMMKLVAYIGTMRIIHTSTSHLTVYNLHSFSLILVLGGIVQILNFYNFWMLIALGLNSLLAWNCFTDLFTWFDLVELTILGRAQNLLYRKIFSWFLCKALFYPERKLSALRVYRSIYLKFDYFSCCCCCSGLLTPLRHRFDQSEPPKSSSGRSRK
ncbi:unnamed protein product [Ceratitis capitata]|uniref:(Mediterranean fruit fly) hypothetical protein n=1 Tax=Ceratitis capitata TaxID=7213 RepID=A0A811UCA3_CERCA|nr:unnamed protein product [Ceratitis capitata]